MGIIVEGSWDNDTSVTSLRHSELLLFSLSLFLFLETKSPNVSVFLDEGVAFYSMTVELEFQRFTLKDDD